MRGMIFFGAGGAGGAAFQIAGGILAAANLYAMMTDPDYLNLIMSAQGGNAFNLIAAQVQLIVSAGGAAKGILYAAMGKGPALAALAKGATIRSAAGLTIYRGVHGKHPRIADARAGRVVPWKTGTSAWDSARHTAGDSSTGFTAWTTDLGVAKRFAGKDGVVVQAIGPPGAIHAVSTTPGVEEFEVHVPGVVEGTVIWGH